MPSTKTSLVAVAILLVVALVAIVAVSNRTSGRASGVAVVADREAGKDARIGSAPATQRPPRQRAETPPAAATETPLPSPRAEPIRRTLERQRVVIDWREEPVEEALAELAERTGVGIVVAPEVITGPSGDALEIESIHLDRPVRASQVLELLCALRGLKWTVEGGRVVIARHAGSGDPARTLVPVRRSASGPPITVSGRVTDASGEPVAGAEILQSTTGTRLAVTGANGRYEVSLQRPYGALAAHADGCVSSPSVGIGWKAEDLTKVDLALGGPAGTLVVRVVDDGGGIEGASVLVGPGTSNSKSAEERDDGRFELSDATGTAQLDGIAVGDVRVTAQARGHEEGSTEATVTLRKRTEVEVRLVRRAPLAQRAAGARMSVSLEHRTVMDVQWQVENATNIPLRIDPALGEKAQDAVVGLPLQDVSLTAVLTELCRVLGDARYELDAEADCIRIVPETR